ncbi:helix-turn-helix domain-containing protein [Agrobacterium vaccinii]|uniref:helix-turn-helix domain-containing protein n=1 Tax=Agrobacterium vaccinii TaxID=2735528 RepID=UPI001E3C887E|nr:helix-turn-helix domain-containing protein [Agrobacterium vaccinii]UHS60590.1 helix-turn-helix domain-containing protein [Agrobacterium vaccinii]
MNHVPQTSQFTCPCCKGFIGEAAPIDAVNDSLSRPILRIILDQLSKRVGRNVRRDAIIEACYADVIDGGPDDAERVFRVNMFNLRKAIKPFGWHIECVGGVGRGQTGGAFYRLMPAEVSP